MANLTVFVKEERMDELKVTMTVTASVPRMAFSLVLKKETTLVSRWDSLKVLLTVPC